MGKVVLQQFDVLERSGTEEGREPLISEGEAFAFLLGGERLLFRKETFQFGFFGGSFLIDVVVVGGGGTLFLASTESAGKSNVLLEQGNDSSGVHVTVGPGDSEEPVVDVEFDFLEGKRKLKQGSERRPKKKKKKKKERNREKERKGVGKEGEKRRRYLLGK